MTILAYLALFGWIPAVVVMFAMWPVRFAATTAAVGAWLLLPPYRLDIAGLPDYSKNMAAGVGMTLGLFIFDPQRMMSFRPRWFDLPIVLFCFSGTIASVVNGLGLYDGLSDALGYIITLMLPYMIGRILFGDPQGMRFFCVGMIVGGLSYVLPCVFESRMSPILLSSVYGVSHWQGTRFGGYRPSVFFWTGLECGMWMTAATLTAWWLWSCGAYRRIGNLPAGLVVVPILFMTSLICRSTGALLLLIAGMAALWLSRRFRTRLLLLGLVLVAPTYAVARISQVWTGEQAVELATSWIGPDRASRWNGGSSART